MTTRYYARGKRVAETNAGVYGDEWVCTMESKERATWMAEQLNIAAAARVLRENGCDDGLYEVTYLYPVTLRVRAGNQSDAEYEAARELCNLKVSGMFVDFSVGFPERIKVTEVNAVSREATEV